jgi:hypothetical protein
MVVWKVNLKDKELSPEEQETARYVYLDKTLPIEQLSFARHEGFENLWRVLQPFEMVVHQVDCHQVLWSSKAFDSVVPL